VIQRIKAIRASERRVCEDDLDSTHDVDSDDAVDSSERQSESITLDSEGRATAITQFDQYVNKGRHLENLSLWDYVGCVKMVRVRNREHSSIEIGAPDEDQIPRRGRPRQNRYSFETGDCFDESFAQVISSVPAIPQLVGPAPPRYPGDKPLNGSCNTEIEK